jgi:hypothetical protein
MEEKVKKIADQSAAAYKIEILPVVELVGYNPLLLSVAPTLGSDGTLVFCPQHIARVRFWHYGGAAQMVVATLHQIMVPGFNPNDVEGPQCLYQ